MASKARNIQVYVTRKMTYLLRHDWPKGWKVSAFVSDSGHAFMTVHGDSFFDIWNGSGRTLGIAEDEVWNKCQDKIKEASQKVGRDE